MSEALAEADSLAKLLLEIQNAQPAPATYVGTVQRLFEALLAALDKTRNEFPQEL